MTLDIGFICTKFKPENGKIPSDVPNSAMYPFGLLANLIRAIFAAAAPRRPRERTARIATRDADAGTPRLLERLDLRPDRR
jgi:hypothetical protein